MQIVYLRRGTAHYMRFAVEASPERPVLVDKFLEDATEVDVDCITDVGQFSDPKQGTIVIGGMLEHIEFAGVHSGDAAMVLPPHTLSQKVIQTIREYTHAMARELKVIGLMNVQYAVKGDTVYVLEVNPRASRTVPFVSRPSANRWRRLAAKVMAGKTLKELGFTEEIWTKYWAVKESVFPFNRFHGQDILLSPEMRSTGEVMGSTPISARLRQVADGRELAAANGGQACSSASATRTRRTCRPSRNIPRSRFRIGRHRRHRAVIEKAGLKVERIYKAPEGPSERGGPAQEPGNPARHQHARRPGAARGRSEDSHHGRLYRHADHDHALSGAKAAALGIAALKKNGYAVKTVQEYH
jgi:carbamoyl-phosphate synthase large subunit